MFGASQSLQQPARVHAWLFHGSPTSWAVATKPEGSAGEGSVPKLVVSAQWIGPALAGLPSHPPSASVTTPNGACGEVVSGAAEKALIQPRPISPNMQASASGFGAV